MASGIDQSLPPAIVSTTKIRSAGFTEVLDTEAMLRAGFAAFQQAGLLPKP